MAPSTLPIAEGAKAPNFVLPTDQGDRVSLADFQKKFIVLYFYPKDDTPGCTKEAVEFSKAQKKFQKAGAIIVGVSKDTTEKHKKFREKHGITIILASDEKGEIIEKYGSWVEKKLYGRRYMGIDRSTFLIDDKGRVRRIWRKVRLAGHVENVLSELTKLRSAQ